MKKVTFGTLQSSEISSINIHHQCMKKNLEILDWIKKRLLELGEMDSLLLVFRVPAFECANKGHPCLEGKVLSPSHFDTKEK